MAAPPLPRPSTRSPPTRVRRHVPGVSRRRAFFRDPRCAGLFGAEAEAAAGCEDGYGGAALDAFNDAALAVLANRSGGLRLHEGEVRAGDVLFVPASSPHQVLNLGAGAITATSMNFVDDTNLAEARRVSLETRGEGALSRLGPFLQAARASLEAPQLHETFVSRLRRGGRTVPGSETRWYERFRMPWERRQRGPRAPRPRPTTDPSHVRDASIRPEDRRVRAAAEMVAGEVSSLDGEPYLEPWPTFSARPWNLDVRREAERGACDDADLGFGGALAALGLADERCGAVVRAFASSNGVSEADMCAVAVDEMAAGLAAAGLAWTAPRAAGGARTALLAELCLATCGAVGVGPCHGRGSRTS